MLNVLTTAIVQCTNTKQCHERFGHLSVSVLKGMKKLNMIVGLPTLSDLSHVCDGQASKISHPKRESKSDKVSSRADTCQPLWKNGWLYYMLVVDAFSRQMWV